MISAHWKHLLCGGLFLILISLNSVLSAQCNPFSIEIAGNGIDEDCDGLDGHFLHLPEFLYMVEGKSFELFFRNICLSTHPHDYVYEVISPLNGQNQGEKWVFIPNSQHIGNHPFTVRIKHPYTGQVLASAFTTVRIAGVTSPSIPAQKVVMMGHSMVDQGIMPHFLSNMCSEAGNPNVSFYGNRISWIDNTTRHQGKGGASWRFFYDDANSPYQFNGQLNMNRYFNENVCPGCDPDIFIIHLGGNDYLFQGLLAGTTIPQIENFIEADYVQNVKPFIDALRAAAPNMKIGVCMEIPGNGRPNAFPNFFGTNSVLGSHYRWRKIMNTILHKYSEKFGNREQENIYLLPIHTGIDDVNHFGDGDPVHPFPQGSMLNDPSGYPSMSTTIYAWMKYIFSQSQGGGNDPKIDLELTVTGSENNPSIFQPFSSTVTIHNYSNTVATNVSVSIPQPNDVIIIAPPFQATQGSYSWYSDKTWNVGTIPAQGSASITVNYYLMTDQALAFYAQVTSADQDDLDSQPNNGDGFDTNEDDEAKFVTNSGTSGGNQFDLELSIAGDASQANAFSNFSTTLTLENKSNIQASNISIWCPRPQLCAYQGGNESQMSTGTFDALNDTWNIPSLAANSTATLTVNYFTLSTNPLNFYSQIALASPTDKDSSPGNGNNQVPVEDDETLFILNEQGTSCGIQVSAFDVLCNNNGTNNNPNDDTFTFKISPSGIADEWIAYFDGQSVEGDEGETITLGPFPISEGSIFVQVKDEENLDCSVDLTVSPPSTCSNGNTGNCLSQSDFPWHEWISRVQIGTYSNSSGKMGYSDFTNDIIDLNQGQNVTASLTAKYSFFTHAEKVKIWIDFNQNGVYEEPSELAFATTITPPLPGSNVSKTVFGAWTIPWSTPNGLARMRVSMQRGVFPEACGNFTFGEVEDYTVRFGGNTQLNFLQNGTELSETKQGDALVYPNPSKSEVFISLKEFLDKKVSLNLIDGLGRSIWSENIIAEERPLRIDVRNFAAGIYALRIGVEDGRPKVIQVVIQE